jgi:hypothetical protein
MTDTITFETARKLKEAGFPQSERGGYMDRHGLFNSAPSIGELIEALPEIIDRHSPLTISAPSPCRVGWAIYYEYNQNYTSKSGIPGFGNAIIHNFLSEALAEMWLLLKKENLIN